MPTRPCSVADVARAHVVVVGTRGADRIELARGRAAVSRFRVVVVALLAGIEDAVAAAGTDDVEAGGVTHRSRRLVARSRERLVVRGGGAVDGAGGAKPAGRDRQVKDA